MKKITTLTVFFCFSVIINPQSLKAEDFLGAPVITSGKTILKTESRLEMVSPFTHEDALRFYEKALQKHKDIKFRDWEDATYIEDDGNLPWHSITISKEDKDGAGIVIVKDNWTWIIGTLVLRYIGVFMVLLFLFLGMTISGFIISRSVERMEAKKR